MALRRTPALLASAALVASIGLAGCSSSADDAASTPTAPATTTTTTPISIGQIPAADRSPAGSSGTEPTVTVPTSAPPSQLEVAELIPGTGPEVKAGSTVEVQYVLATYSSQKVVQSSWSSQPFSFTVGQGMVIEGWDLGLVGAKQGGRYELIIPSSLGYGAQSPGAGIAPNDTLVFVVDVLKVS